MFLLNLLRKVDTRNLSVKINKKRDQEGTMPCMHLAELVCSRVTFI